MLITPIQEKKGDTDSENEHNNDNEESESDNDKSNKKKTKGSSKRKERSESESESEDDNKPEPKKNDKKKPAIHKKINATKPVQIKDRCGPCYNCQANTPLPYVHQIGSAGIV